MTKTVNPFTLVKNLTRVKYQHETGKILDDNVLEKCLNKVYAIINKMEGAECPIAKIYDAIKAQCTKDHHEEYTLSPFVVDALVDMGAIQPKNGCVSPTRFNLWFKYLINIHQEVKQSAEDLKEVMAAPLECCCSKTKKTSESSCKCADKKVAESKSTKDPKAAKTSKPVKANKSATPKDKTLKTPKDKKPKEVKSPKDSTPVSDKK